MIYLHFFIGLLKSVSIRILNEFINNNAKTISVNDLKNTYSNKDMIDIRIKSLIKNKWIFTKNSNFNCTNKAIFLVKINLLFLMIFKIKDSG